MQKVGVTSMSLHKPRRPEIVFRDAVQQPGPDVRERTQPIAREVYLKVSDIDLYGSTVGCPRCEHDGIWGPGCTVNLHSKICKVSLVEELKKTPEGRARLDAANVRLARASCELSGPAPQGEIESVPAPASSSGMGPSPTSNPVAFVPL